MSASTKKLTVLAMLTALSAVLITLVHFPLFPAAAFLEYDPADVAILIGTFAFGPMAGLAVTVIASAIQAFLLGGAGMYGFLMHVIASGTLVLENRAGSREEFERLIQEFFGDFLETMEV